MGKEKEPTWLKTNRLVRGIERQEREGWCFLAVAQAVLKHYGEERTQEELKEVFETTQEDGTDIYQAIGGFQDLGYSVIYKTRASILDLEKSLHCNLPVLVCWWHDLEGKPEGHYSLVENIRKLGWNITIDLLDPEIGKTRSFEWEDFRKRWWAIEGEKTTEQPMLIICPKEK